MKEEKLSEKSMTNKLAGI